MWSYQQGVRYILPVCILSILAGLLLSIPCFADSQVRMVRLSDVEGAVQIDRNTGQGFEKAFINLPITQGVVLRTGKDGFAAVEFEDGSTLRITPESEMRFLELKRRDSGAKVSVASLQQGMAYVSYVGARNDEFSLEFGPQTLKLDKAAHLRLQVDRSHATLAVFKGEVQVASPSGIVEVGKKQTASFDLTGGKPYTLAKNVEENPYDAWDKEQSDYVKRYARRDYNNSPYVYGWNDLSYYGNFFDVAGYGMLWQPYFAGAGWNPFMDGLWAFYPGAGYGWVSAYPWGWVPYHYGSWMFLPAYGWVWQPGGAWMGVNNTPTVMNPPRGFRPPLAPASPSRSLIAVGRGPAQLTVGNSNRLLIRNNTASLGIPRGSIGNLSRMSQHVERRGFVNARIQPQTANPVLFRTMQRPPNAPFPAASSRSWGAGPRNSAPGSGPALRPMPSPGAMGGSRGGGRR